MKTPTGPLLALVVLACTAPPRSAAYFTEHRREADQLADECRTGAHRGDECLNAQAAIAALKRDERVQRYRKAF